MKKILLHVCCGPCAAAPVPALREEGIEPVAFFHNPNIHPFREFRRRLNSFVEFAAIEKLKTEIDRDYGLVEYLRKVVGRENARCRICYEMRLAETAERAAALGMDTISTTLLYSRYQNHELIRRTGEEIAAARGLSFLYRDWRHLWQRGIDRAIELDLYRQGYCGCIYSEQERYDKKLRRRMRSGKAHGVAAAGVDSEARSLRAGAAEGESG